MVISLGSANWRPLRWSAYLRRFAALAISAWILCPNAACGMG